MKSISPIEPPGKPDNAAVQVRKAINFEPPDYLPFWDNFWDGFPELWQQRLRLPQGMEPDDYYGRCVRVLSGNETLFPSLDKKIIKTNGEYEICSDGWGRIVKVARNGYFSQTISRMLETTANLEKLRPEPAGLRSRYTGLRQQALRQQEKGVFCFAKIGGLYCRGHFVRGEEALLMDMMLEKNFCHEFFDLLTEHFTKIALKILEHTGLWQNGLIVYDDMAGNSAPNFGPDTFAEYLLPRYKKLIATVRQAGCARVFFHSDGNIGPFLDLLLEAGFSGFNPLEPRCGLDLLKLREKYGRKMVFCGGVCNTIILPRGDKKEIEAHIRPLIELGRDGGLIIGQASVSTDIAPEIYDYYMSLLRIYGNYTS